jgi:hypothetical protein
MAAVSQGCRAVAYRRPEQTTLYQVVQQHLETYLALAGEDDWDGQRVFSIACRNPSAMAPRC